MAQPNGHLYSTRNVLQLLSCIRYMLLNHAQLWRDYFQILQWITIATSCFDQIATHEKSQCIVCISVFKKVSLGDSLQWSSLCTCFFLTFCSTVVLLWFILTRVGDYRSPLFALFLLNVWCTSKSNKCTWFFICFSLNYRVTVTDLWSPNSHRSA